MIMIPQFRQNKISGMSIAWGRGSWDNEVGCYVFPTDDSYQIRVTDSYLMDNGICEDDMLDCISQIEEEYGAPSVHRTALGLFKNSGYSNLGLTVISRTNPSISCVFTPTSTEEKLTDAYFEWYFNESDPSVIDLPRYMNRFDNMTGNRASNVTMSPVMPSYMEAQEFFNAHREISESVKENILRGVWQHQTTKDKGFKVRLEREVLPEWTKIKESSMRITGNEMREGLQFVEGIANTMKLSEGMIRITLHWYDDITKEGVFKDKHGKSISANFEWDKKSHELAKKGKTGETFLTPEEDLKSSPKIINKIEAE